MENKIGDLQISIPQFIAQWRTKPHMFQANLWSFEVKAGKTAQAVFRESFDLERFNKPNSTPWKPRAADLRAKKARKTIHIRPILTQTETLKKSITWKHLGGKNKPLGVNIYTDPDKFWTSASHKGFCYAAVHNDPSGTHSYGNTSSPSIQRQFMGHSSTLRIKLEENATPIIFKGFPK